MEHSKKILERSFPLYSSISLPHIIGYSRKKHEENIDGLSPGIKDQAPQEENQILHLPGNQEIADHKNRQKPKKKQYTAEYHSLYSVFTPESV